MKKDIYVVGALIIEDGEILCAQRGPGRVLPFKGEFPGGKIEEGESPQDALSREINEEIQCKVEIGDEIDHTIYEYDFGIVHLTILCCKLIEGKPVKTEHVSIRWLSPDQLSSLDWAPADIPAIQKLSRMFLAN
jgi:8-oxo-dGTP diphosphatase